jgi:hypothetical protein
MSDVRWKCPGCGAIDPKIVSETVTVVVDHSQEHVHLIICGNCRVILGTLLR